MIVPACRGTVVVVPLTDEYERQEFDMVRISSFVLASCLVASVSFAQGLVEKGKQVYIAEKCSVCHSVAGVGNKKGALDGIGAKLSADEIRAWITNAAAMAAKVKAERKPPMKAYSTLATDEVDALVAYVQTLK
jgi:mono/diheme cytochrome c family protein